MMRIAMVVWVLTATVLAGVFVLALLMMAPNSGPSMTILWAALAGCVVAIPVSVGVAKAIAAKTIA